MVIEPEQGAGGFGSNADLGTIAALIRLLDRAQYVGVPHNQVGLWAQAETRLLAVIRGGGHSNSTRGGNGYSPVRRCSPFWSRRAALALPFREGPSIWFCCSCCRRGELQGDGEPEGGAEAGAGVGADAAAQHANLHGAMRRDDA